MKKREEDMEKAKKEEEAMAKKLNGLEKPGQITLKAGPSHFSVENGIMTPTFKMMRANARKMYKAEIEQLRADFTNRRLVRFVTLFTQQAARLTLPLALLARLGGAHFGRPHGGQM